MRIIAGESKGATLVPVKDAEVRPTLDRVRESVFNIISPYLDDECMFADLFAGTGVNGLEALSRGARKSIFIDSANASLKMVQQNIEKLGYRGNSAVVRGGVVEKLGFALRQHGSAQIVYADPPFNYLDYDGLLVNIDASGIVAQKGLVLIEHGAKSVLPSVTGSLERFRESNYGRTQVSFYRNGSDES